MWEHQITSLRTLFPFVKETGFYIVEDLQTNYGPMMAAHKGVASATCIEYLKKWLDLRVVDDQIMLEDIEDAFLRTYGRSVEFMAFYRRACLIKKQFHSVHREHAIGIPLMPLSEQVPHMAISILAHVSTFGDVIGDDGFINCGSGAGFIQGVRIRCAEVLFEYRVRFADKTWSSWNYDSFIGTRGESKALTGITVRLLGDMKSRFTIRTVGRFLDNDRLIEAADGEDCISANAGGGAR